MDDLRKPLDEAIVSHALDTMEIELPQLLEEHYQYQCRTENIRRGLKIVTGLGATALALGTAQQFPAEVYNPAGFVTAGLGAITTVSAVLGLMSERFKRPRKS